VGSKSVMQAASVMCVHVFMYVDECAMACTCTYVCVVLKGLTGSRLSALTSWPCAAGMLGLRVDTT
jgi:hypothetical protein